MQDGKIKIVAIVGPTASGKSAVALEVAKALSGEIVSCDSMQVYRDMNIGTAKPTEDEIAIVPHHMINIVDAGENFSCADYSREAQTVIADIAKRGKLPVLCGGTGLYLDSILRGGSFQNTYVDLQYREELYTVARENSNKFIHAMLEKIDEQAAGKIHPNNVKRVIRALEIHKTSGLTKTEADKQSRQNDSPYQSIIIGLRYADREILYKRIDQRVEKMIESGLIDEIRTLDERGVFKSNSTAAQAIGYKELLSYLRGEMSIEVAVDELKRATRHYAKRQLTWFTAKSNVIWVDVDEKFTLDKATFEDIVNNIIKLFYDNGFCGIMK